MLHSSTTRRLAILVHKRGLYIGSHAIYPSPQWAGKKMMVDFRYDEIINPMMISGGMEEDQAPKMEEMLREQGVILQQRGNAHLLNPLKQTVAQYLYGVEYFENSKSRLIEILEKLDFLNSDGSLHNIKYANAMNDWMLAEDVKREFKKDQLLAKDLNIAVSALNGMSSNAMDTVYFANMWLYFGISEKLGGRPISILQTPKYATRQIERYYSTIASMALGVTPILIGGGNEIYDFEGMADLAPTVDNAGNPIAICAKSSRSASESYKNFKRIHEKLAIKDFLPKNFIVEFKEEYKELIYHLDLGVHVDENETIYLAENLLTTESHDRLVDFVGKERIVYIPESEWKLYAMNFILFDSRFNATQNVAIVRKDCPVLIRELERSGYKVYKRDEMFLNGGGSARCRFAFFEKAKQHTLESFLEEQKFVEDTLGSNYPVVPQSKVDEFISVYDSMDLQRIIYNHNTL